MEGKVIRSTGSSYTVESGSGELIECKLKGKFRIKGIRATNPIAVGDVVGYIMFSESNQGVIEQIQERKNYIIRKATKLSKATHIIASNIDQVVVIASIIKPRTSTGFIDRVLTTAEAYHIPSVVVFNKYDLYEAEQLELLEYYEVSYKSAGYHVLATSVPLNKNLDLFKAFFSEVSGQELTPDHEAAYEAVVNQLRVAEREVER